MTCAHTIGFASDLKLAHYIKIPPRHTFMAQVVATLVTTVVTLGILNFQLNTPKVCTDDAPDKMFCPGIMTFFTASVMWGTIGPKKVFGEGGQYTAMLAGWAIGFVFPFITWWIQKRYPHKGWVRQIHPITFLFGGLNWAPYNLSYVLPALPFAYVSWIWCKNRYLAFWAKYNFVFAAALSTGIALSSVVVFFALQNNGIYLDWWGNNVMNQGCEDFGNPCPLLTLKEGQHI